MSKKKGGRKNNTTKTKRPERTVTEMSVEEAMKEHDRMLDEIFGVSKWHCDDLWAEKTLPECVQKFLDIKRAPAVDQIGKKCPTLFADYNGKRVKVNMASRFGDVGITVNLKAPNGYEERVYIPELQNFSTRAKGGESIWTLIKRTLVKLVQSIKNIR